MAAPESADGETAPDNLAQRCHVRGNLEVFLCAAGGDPVADYLVENQDDTILGGELPQHGQELVGGGQHPYRPQHRLDDDGGQLLLVLLQYFPRRFGFIEGQHHHRIQHALGQALGGGYGAGTEALAGLAGVYSHADADGIVAAVVAALGLGDEAAASESAGRPDGVQRGLGAGVGEPHQLETGDALAQQPGQPHLMPVGSVVHHTLLKLGAHRLDHRLRGVAQDQCSHRAYEVQPVRSVGVHHVGSGSAVDEDGVGFPEDGVAAVSAGQVALRLLPRRLGLGGQLQVAVHFVAHWRVSGKGVCAERRVTPARERRAVGNRCAAMSRCLGSPRLHR